MRFANEISNEISNERKAQSETTRVHAQAQARLMESEQRLRHDIAAMIKAVKTKPDAIVQEASEVSAADRPVGIQAWYYHSQLDFQPSSLQGSQQRSKNTIKHNINQGLVDLWLPPLADAPQQGYGIDPRLNHYLPDVFARLTQIPSAQCVQRSARCVNIWRDHTPSSGRWWVSLTTTSLSTNGFTVDLEILNAEGQVCVEVQGLTCEVRDFDKTVHQHKPSRDEQPSQERGSREALISAPLMRETQIKEAQIKETQIKETQIKETQIKETQIKETRIRKIQHRKTRVVPQPLIMLPHELIQNLEVFDVESPSTGKHTSGFAPIKKSRDIKLTPLHTFDQQRIDWLAQQSQSSKFVSKPNHVTLAEEPQNSPLSYSSTFSTTDPSTTVSTTDSTTEQKQGLASALTLKDGGDGVLLIEPHTDESFSTSLTPQAQCYWRMESMLQALTLALQCANDPEKAIKVLCFRDAGQANGLLPASLSTEDRSFAVVQPYLYGVFRSVIENLVNFPLPVIAELRSDAVGNSFFFMSLCDAVIASREAYYGAQSLGQHLGWETLYSEFYEQRFGVPLAQALLMNVEPLLGKEWQRQGWPFSWAASKDIESQTQKILLSWQQKSRLSLELLKSHLSQTLIQTVNQAMSHISEDNPACTSASTSEAHSVRQPEISNSLVIEITTQRAVDSTAVDSTAVLNAFDAVRHPLSTGYHSVVLVFGVEDGAAGEVHEQDSTLQWQHYNALKQPLLECELPIVAVFEQHISGLDWLLGLLCDVQVYNENAQFSLDWHAIGQESKALNELVGGLGTSFGPSLSQHWLLAHPKLTGAELACLEPSLKVVKNAKEEALQMSIHQFGLSQSDLRKNKAQRWVSDHGLLDQSVFEPLPIEPVSTETLPTEALPIEALSLDSPEDLSSANSMTIDTDDLDALVPLEIASEVVDIRLTSSGVAWIKMQDKSAKNMFSPELVSGLKQAFQCIEDNAHVKAVVLSGYDSYFATGGTKQTLLDIQEGKAQFTDEKAFLLPLECSVPVVVAMQGHAIGGGWSFGMYGDVVLFSEESRYLSPYMGYGFTPGAGSTCIMPYHLGHDIAKLTLISAEEIKGVELKAQGMRLAVLPRKDMVTHALQLAKRMTQFSRSSLVRLKQTWAQPLRFRLERVFKDELRMHDKTFVKREDTLSLIQTSFQASHSAHDPKRLQSSQHMIPEGIPEGTEASLEPTSSTSKIDTSLFTVQDIMTSLRGMLARELHLEVDEVDDHTQFIDLGLDSITGVTWVKHINREYQLNVEATKVYTYPTLESFAEYVQSLLKPSPEASYKAVPTQQEIQSQNISTPEAAHVSGNHVSGNHLTENRVTEKVVDPEVSVASKISSTSESSVDLPSFEAIVLNIRSLLSQELHIPEDEIDNNDAFIDIGLDSITGVTLVRNINDCYGIEMDATKVYTYSTLDALSQYVLELQRETVSSLDQAQSHENTPTSTSSSPQQSKPVLPFSDPTDSSDVHLSTARPSNATYSNNADSSSSSLSPSHGVFDARFKVNTLKTWRSADGLNQKFYSVAETYEDTSAANSPRQASRHSSRYSSFDSATDAIAIVGMAGQFAQANSVEAFWEALSKGESGIRQVDTQRWNIKDWYQPGAPTPGKTNSCWLGALEDYDCFDPLFFNISPSEAETMDPQQRLVLQNCWHSIEHAGYNPQSLSGQACGVFIGCGTSDYHEHAQEQRLSAQGFTGAASSILAARIAYFLNLKGPCVAVETACSSSLVAIAQACDSLNNHNSDVALAGGVYVMAGPAMHVMTSQAGMLSTDGRCFTFDRRANGFVPGEGVGILMLKRLADAERDGDQILSVIEGWGINQDGKTNGITAPNEASQTALHTSVYDKFGINPADIQVIEAHGTGTKLGDPIEVNGLKEAFKPYTHEQQFCALGSVKSNIGHCLTAAGVAGVIKLILSIQHRQIPPTINFEQLNEHIQLNESPFYINDHLQDWTVKSDQARRAAVSSFGFSGTNAHMVISEYQFTEAQEPALSPEINRSEDQPQMVVLSAKNQQQLKELVQSWLRFLPSLPSHNVETSQHAMVFPSVLKRMAYTSQLGREAMDVRLACLVSSVAELQAVLKNYLVNGPDQRKSFSGNIKEHKQSLALLTQDREVREALLEKWLMEHRWQKVFRVVG